MQSRAGTAAAARTSLMFLCFALPVLVDIHPHAQVLARSVSHSDLHDISAILFPIHRSPLAREDTWTRLDSHDREAWTYANYQLHHEAPFENATSQLTSSSSAITVPVRVVVLTGDQTINISLKLSDFESHMRAVSGIGPAQITAAFKLELAPSELVERLRIATDPMSIHAAFEHEYNHNSRWHGANVLFAMVNYANLSVPVDKPHLGKERMSWILCHRTAQFLDILVVVERAVERIYLPQPLYYPVPFSENLRISVHPYTPEHEHRALWFQEFDWPAFEATVRAIAPHGQTVGFFATQSNAECPICAVSFRNLDALYRDRAKNAVATILKHQNELNLSRTNVLRRESSDHSKQDHSVLEIFVVDTVLVANQGSKALENLENMSPAVFPGIAVVTMRSSQSNSIERLKQRLITAIAASSYGIASAGDYVAASSDILEDLIARNIVRSLLTVWSSNIAGLLQDLTEFGINPSKVLGNREYARLLQRLNLLLGKLRYSREALSQSNDATSSLHYVMSARHDVHSIREIFGLRTNGQPPASAGFRDPTFRCHFSRIKRGALRAGFMIERSTLHYSGPLAMILVYILALLGTYFLGLYLLPTREDQRKQL